MRPVARGFALLLVVTLLTFLVLLALGLAALVGIGSAAASSARHQAQAREFALLANQLALAQLQKFAGPDQRAIATGETAAGSGHPHWTGVWDSSAAGPGALAWLVSGNENRPLAELPSRAAGADCAELVGANTSGVARDVVAPLQSVEATGVPGAQPGAPAVIGRYAWWVGDQGVKAAVAVAGQTDGGLGKPFDSAELRSRIRQQVPLGAGAADAAGQPVFEIRDFTNASIAAGDRVLAFEQLAFLRDASSEPLGLERRRVHFHDWSPNNRAVLANSKGGGLRQDLSLRPDLLGAAFVAWMNYADYMEAPAAEPGGATTSIFPAYGVDPIRRRHRIGAPASAGGLVFSRAPVLSSFFLQFNVRRVGGNAAPATTNALEVRARMVAQLWNPWTTALIPEPLRLEITGLPDIAVEDSNGGRNMISLQGLFGQPMKAELTAEDAAFPGDADDRSWLPGRAYAWRSKGGSRGAWQTEFYNRTLSVPNASVWTAPAGTSYAAPASNNVRMAVSSPPSQLEVVLRTAAGVELSRILSPAYAAFSTTPQRVNSNDEYRFGFPLRIVDPVDYAAASDGQGWLTGSEPRALVAGEPLFRAGSGGDLPSAYVGVGGNSVLSDENRLLDRVMGKTGMSYNEDTPVFELLRSPPLSLGQLQHLQIAGARPFSIGNSWGSAESVNGVRVGEFFDRFYFSGLRTEEISAAPASRLPNPLLRVASRHAADGTPISLQTVREVPGGYSAKHLLQDGAFNINSVNVAAWIAVLRSGRIAPPPAFTYLDSLPATGTAGDTALAALTVGGAAFHRFPQSAQETYKADAGYAASVALPPDEPAVASHANTHLYRRGLRILVPGEVALLANAIVTAIRAWQAQFGPFRSLEEFLSAHPLFEQRSVLEKAIAEAGINSQVAEFSSQWLTQADILSMLAPVLFSRSDTFMIRSYGEATNPATGETEGRAWCESIVQRLPEYFDPQADDAPVAPAELSSPLNQLYGRRFKVVSFRWLNRSDI